MDKSQRRKFKSELALHGITMKQFCEVSNINYNVFNQEFNEHRTLQAKHEIPALRYIGETPTPGESS